MTCYWFKPSSECAACLDERCSIKGGNVAPSEMCGCDCCDNCQIWGDRTVCNAKIDDNREKAKKNL